MRVEPTSYPGWGNHPAYRVNSFNDYMEICRWMHEWRVEHFLLSSGSSGYTFQVRENKEWFALRWA